MSEIINLNLDSNYIDLDNRTNTDAPLSYDEALFKCLDTFGYVNMRWIVEACKSTIAKVREALKGAIYQNPDTWEHNPYLGWETKNQYISGNVRDKYNKALTASTLYPGLFEQNVQDLKSVVPAYLGQSDIFVTLGSPWIPEYIIRYFLIHINSRNANTPCDVIHDRVTGSWFITNKGYVNNANLYTTYGTRKMNAYEIIEHLLNHTEIVCYKEDKTNALPGAKGKRVIDTAATLAANEKAELIKAEFHNWVWSSLDTRATLRRIYSKTYGSFVNQTFDGSFLTFPNKNPDIKLRKYQVDAIARMIFSPNTLLAHDVGSGKTYEMIAAGEEMIRMGLSKKNLYVVPNGLISEWRKSFKELYPNAKLYTIEPKMMTPKNREATLNTVMGDSYTSIIIPYSSFDSIPLSFEVELERVSREFKELYGVIARGKNVTRTTKIRFNKVKSKFKELQAKVKSDEITFDQLGVTRLFVDEAHNYKNLELEGMSGAAGSHSSKCTSFYDKVRYIQHQNNGKGVVLATATPITNSVAELFVIQTYLQRGQLKLLGLDKFSAWIGNYAEMEHHFEVGVNTNEYKMVPRYSKFHNLKDLQKLLSYIIDYHQMNTADGLPNFNGYTDVKIERSKEFIRYLKDISIRADKIKRHKVSATEDNFLKITSDGRKAALDMRLINPNIYPKKMPEQYKIKALVDNVLDIYYKYEDIKATQLIFSDLSIPTPDKWNVYDNIKDILVRNGVKASEVAFIQDYDSPRQREKLFKQVNSGEIRILIGSTFKLGTGVNVQEKLIAIHHLDVPWRPSDMVQREGRLIRLGNTNKEVFIYRYILLESFDAFSWQTLERKELFITALLGNNYEERDANDVSDTVLNYAEVKAIAIGNPLIKERCEVQNEIYRLKALDKKEEDHKNKLLEDMETTKDLIESYKARIEELKSDRSKYKLYLDAHPDINKKALGEELYSKYLEVMENEDRIQFAEYMSFPLFKAHHTETSKKKYIQLVGSAIYTIEVPKTGAGLISRLDSVLEGIDAAIEDYEDKIKRDTQLLESMKTVKFSTHNRMLTFLTNKLKSIDEKLKEEIN